jgi:hypothetical protein
VRLPTLSPRIADLARQVTVSAADADEAARRLSTFLASSYRYTLQLGRTPALEPLEDFLFGRRAGNCEYFAAALAVMLRTLDIPARVVAGFQRGEWNPYGRYFMVRLRDAHSWVEAYTAAGWTTFDPSPRASADLAARPGLVGLYLDALRMRWYRYVVNWSAQDQALAALRAREVVGLMRTQMLREVDWTRAAVALAALALAATTATVAWRRRLPTRATRAVGAPDFYRRALRCLARRGHRPAPGESAREFQARVREGEPDIAAPLASLTAAYERVRFGAAALDAEEAAAVATCLATLERRRVTR